MSKKEIDKRKDCSQNNVFWNKWYEEMALKTVMSAGITKKVTLDPAKIDTYYKIALESERSNMEEAFRETVEAHANTVEIDVTPDRKEALPEPEQTEVIAMPEAPKQKVEEPVKEEVVAAPKSADEPFSQEEMGF